MSVLASTDSNDLVTIKQHNLVTQIYHIRQNTISCGNTRNYNTEEPISFHYINKVHFSFSCLNEPNNIVTVLVFNFNVDLFSTYSLINSKSNGHILKGYLVTVIVN